MASDPTRMRTTPNQFGTVYRAYDADDVLLYVGVTASPWRRMLRHRRSHWWSEVTYIEWEFFVTYGAAVDVEREAILSEHPLHNRVSLGD